MGGKIRSTKAFIKEVKKQLEIKSFLSIYSFILNSGVCPKTTPDEWFSILAEMHLRGWLFVDFANKRINVVVGAYRIKEFDEKLTEVLPEKEEGNILYVAFAASKSEDKHVFKKMMDRYVHYHPEIEEVILYERNSDDKIKRFRIKESSNVKAESSKYPERAAAAAEPVSRPDTEPALRNSEPANIT